MSRAISLMSSCIWVRYLRSETGTLWMTLRQLSGSDNDVSQMASKRSLLTSMAAIGPLSIPCTSSCALARAVRAPVSLSVVRGSEKEQVRLRKTDLFPRRFSYCPSSPSGEAAAPERLARLPSNGSPRVGSLSVQGSCGHSCPQFGFVCGSRFAASSRGLSFGCRLLPF